MSMILEPPTLLQNRYRLLHEIGRGSMAIIYRAHDDTLSREVAIKFLAPQRLVSSEASERFLREARMIASLTHPNIMLLYDMGREDTWHYLVLEHIQGRNVRERVLQRGGNLTLEEVLPIMRGTLAGLAYAHQRGIVHRDIKPENIMLTDEAQVKVTDFGLALSQHELRLTDDDMILGTVFYMSPEMLMGKTADSRSDLYALGVVFYELLFGVPPFVGDSMMSVVSQIINAPLHLPALPHLPENIREIIRRLMARDPAERFASADEVLQALPTFEKSVERVSTDPDSLRMYAAQEEKSSALEVERRYVAGLVQNNVIEPLNLLLAQVNMYEQTLPMNQQTRMVTSVLASLVRQVLQQARDLEANLSPAMLDTLGLELALESLVNQWRRVSGATIYLTVTRLKERLPQAIELAVFRAAQEALEFAMQRASQVTLALEMQEGALLFTVTDNGLAAVTDAVLRTSRARLEHLGGVIDIRTTPNLSLTIRLDFAPPAQLTAREMEVLQQLAKGLSNKEIAALLDISPRTVNFHLDNLYSKLGVNSRTEALIYALRQGWISSTLFK